VPQSIQFNAPFAEQLDFFKKKLQLPSERWDDIMRAAHDRAFIVAGAANADLVNDLHGAIQRAIAEGKGIEAFRKDFKQIVLRNGWVGWTGEGSKAGHAWRTRVIYQTNMSTSYAAGRWKQLTDPDLLSVRPYWRYIHSDLVVHPRPMHLAWDGLVLPHDHPFWRAHFPPNGWGCQCRVSAVDMRAYSEAKDAGKAVPPEGWDTIDPKTGAPPGIDHGWDYAPGANVDAPLKSFIDDKLVKLDSPVGAAMFDAMRPVLQAELNAEYQAFLGDVLADPLKRGRTAIVGAIEPATISWLDANHGVVPATAEIALQDAIVVGKKAVRHQAAGDALTAAEWSRLPDILANPDQVLYDVNSGKLLYVSTSTDPNEPRDTKVAIEFDYALKKTKGMTNMIVSAFKLPGADIAGAIAGGLYQVVK
jgi:hypothetical protein